MGKQKNACRILVVNSEREILLRRCRPPYENNLNLVVEDVGCEIVDYSYYSNKYECIIVNNIASFIRNMSLCRIYFLVRSVSILTSVAESFQ
jgi:hypothetical protein